jgi:hypothetical protein
LASQMCSLDMWILVQSLQQLGWEWWKMMFNLKFKMFNPMFSNINGMRIFLCPLISIEVWNKPMQSRRNLVDIWIHILSNYHSHSKSTELSAQFKDAPRTLNDLNIASEIAGYYFSWSGCCRVPPHSTLA